jgi:hypothetical protein
MRQRWIQNKGNDGGMKKGTRDEEEGRNFDEGRKKMEMVRWIRVKGRDVIHFLFYLNLTSLI